MPSWAIIYTLEERGLVASEWNIDQPVGINAADPTRGDIVIHSFHSCPGFIRAALLYNISCPLAFGQSNHCLISKQRPMAGKRHVAFPILCFRYDIIRSKKCTNIYTSQPAASLEGSVAHFPFHCRAPFKSSLFLYVLALVCYYQSLITTCFIKFRRTNWMLL